MLSRDHPQRRGRERRLVRLRRQLPGEAVVAEPGGRWDAELHLEVHPRARRDRADGTAVQNVCLRGLALELLDVARTARGREVERLPAGVRDGDVVVEALAAMDAECAKAALDRNAS